MSEITLEFLARQNERIIAELPYVRDQNDTILPDVNEIKERLGLLVGSYASLPGRVDLLDSRLALVERQLGLIKTLP